MQENVFSVRGDLKLLHGLHTLAWLVLGGVAQLGSLTAWRGGWLLSMIAYLVAIWAGLALVRCYYRVQVSVEGIRQNRLGRAVEIRWDAVEAVRVLVRVDEKLQKYPGTETIQELEIQDSRGALLRLGTEYDALRSVYERIVEKVPPERIQRVELKSSPSARAEPES